MQHWHVKVIQVILHLSTCNFASSMPIFHVLHCYDN